MREVDGWYSICLYCKKQGYIMKRLKLGFIGGGLDSAVGTTHKIASQMDGRFELAAGSFNLDQGINKRTAKLWHVERVYPSWKELLLKEKGKIDAVVVLTPTPVHAKIIVEAVKLGYPVISEKALTAAIPDALRIRKTLKKYNGYLAVTYNYTGYPMLRELRSIAKQKRLGRVRQVHIEMPQEGFARLGKDGRHFTPQKWRLHDGEIPTISLDLGVHIHSIIYFVTGERPVEAIAVQNSFGFFKQVIDNVVAIVKYTGDIVCNIWYSKTALGDSNGLKVRVYGEKGSAEWYQMDPENIYLYDNKGKPMIIDRGSVNANISAQARYNRFKVGHPAGFIEAFANLYNDIADSIISYKRGSNHKSGYVMGIDESIEGLSMLKAIAKSAKSRSWEKIRG